MQGEIESTEGETDTENLGKNPQTSSLGGGDLWQPSRLI